MLLEGFQVVHYTATEEGNTFLERRFVDNLFGSYGFDEFHHTLNGALAEIVAVALHGQTENSYYRELIVDFLNLYWLL